jgi:starch synthase
MKVLIASPEVVPYVKTGGLADVAGTLANALMKTGTEAFVILPLYRKIREHLKVMGITPMSEEISVPLGTASETGRLWRGETPGGANVFFIQNDRFFDRDYIYGTPEGDYSDNASRFIFYSRGVLEAVKALDLGVDIIHCNDWQTGLIPVYIKTLYRDEFPDTATLLTVHNLGYQGIFWHLDMPLTGLGWEMFNMNALEFNGKINLLKGGLLFADSITTVSRTYSTEIQTPGFGFGLEDVLKERREALHGIMNGIDYSEWSPWKDKLIPSRYNRKNISGKVICKKYLQRECGLPEDDSPLIGMVTRLSSQKGIDLVADSMEEVMRSGARVVILGRGEKYYHDTLLNLQARYGGRLSVTLGYDNAYAHRIYAGSDIFLMPSRYEPCGLGQLIALRYGAIPVGRKTGGFADSVTEYDISSGSGTGFLFKNYSSDAMKETIQRALRLYQNRDAWRNIVRNAMSRDFSWRQSVKEYLSLYKKILNEKNKEKK